MHTNDSNTTSAMTQRWVERALQSLHHLLLQGWQYGFVLQVHWKGVPGTVLRKILKFSQGSTLEIIAINNVCQGDCSAHATS